MDLNVALLRESFSKIKPVAGQVAEKFFNNLWTDYPQTQTFFRNTNMAAQRFAFFQALAFIVDNLDKPGELEPFLRKLGALHLAHGVQDHHYGWAGVTLIKTLGPFLAADWTQSLINEWAKLYQKIAEMMQAGSSEHTGIEPALPSPEHLATASAGLGTKLDPWFEKRVEPPVTAAPAPAPNEPTFAFGEKVELPADLQLKIRNGVQDAVRRAIRTEIEKVAAEELAKLDSHVRDFLKKAA